MPSGAPRFLSSVLVAAGSLLGCSGAARADLVHEGVSGVAAPRVAVRGVGEIAWDDLGSPKVPGTYALALSVRGEAIEVPHCNGRERVLVDGAVRCGPTCTGPVVLRLGDDAVHTVTIEVKASAYEKRIACSGPPRIGAVVAMTDGLARLRFESPHRARGGGEAVVFLPGGHDRARPSALLVGTHPWNGGPWTYAAYRELLDEAARSDLVLLMPSGLGNSLYVADAEDEVMRAIDALSAEMAIDQQRVSIWGASMGGAGATTIAFHRPDRFAFVASWFGDSRYDLGSYVRGVLGGEDGARRVNALDVLENARHLPVFLVHGDDDHVSPVKQSTMLEAAMKHAGFDVSLRREPGMGHEGPLVVKHIGAVVRRAAEAVAPRRPARVSFRSVRASDTAAYGVRLVRPDPGSSSAAFVDVERRADGVHVLAAEGVARIELASDALGAGGEVPVRVDVPGVAVKVLWAR